MVVLLFVGFDGIAAVVVSLDALITFVVSDCELVVTYIIGVIDWGASIIKFNVWIAELPLS